MIAMLALEILFILMNKSYMLTEMSFITESPHASSTLIFFHFVMYNFNMPLQTMFESHRLFGLGVLSKFTGCRHVQMSKTPVFAIKANFSNYSVETVKSGNNDALFSFGT